LFSVHAKSQNTVKLQWYEDGWGWQKISNYGRPRITQTTFVWKRKLDISLE